MDVLSVYGVEALQNHHSYKKKRKGIRESSKIILFWEPLQVGVVRQQNISEYESE